MYTCLVFQGFNKNLKLVHEFMHFTPNYLGDDSEAFEFLGETVAH